MIGYPLRVAGVWALRLTRIVATIAVVLPVFLVLDALLRCVMCDRPCASALDPADLGRAGELVPLCPVCFDHQGRLMHAMAFARARWR